MANLGSVVTSSSSSNMDTGSSLTKIFRHLMLINLIVIIAINLKYGNNYGFSSTYFTLCKLELMDPFHFCFGLYPLTSGNKWCYPIVQVRDMELLKVKSYHVKNVKFRHRTCSLSWKLSHTFSQPFFKKGP